MGTDQVKKVAEATPRSRPGLRISRLGDASVVPTDAIRGDRLSVEDSATVVRLIARWMATAGVTSTYQLYLLADVRRASIYRWLSGGVRLPIAGARKLIEALSDETASEELQDAFDELMPSESFEVRLRSELRLRGVRVRRAMDAIRAAGVPIPPDA